MKNFSTGLGNSQKNHKPGTNYTYILDYFDYSERNTAVDVLLVEVSFKMFVDNISVFALSLLPLYCTTFLFRIDTFQKFEFNMWNCSL